MTRSERSLAADDELTEPGPAGAGDDDGLTRLLAIREGEAGDDVLLPCPFCGGDAAPEPHPWLEGCLRIACGNGGCRVGPHTEYLLACFADELCAAWNGRPARA